ncbi:unnamed protein product [Rangifer tarandus platyrhynchus]|uniref:Uncharacterized protein n=1 Tax=Rangifer tarandus platyrhynchus TaxID=3082113 RepID=A0AC59ZFM3_RANTA
MQTEPLSSRRGPRHDSFWAATNAAQLQANILSLCSPHLFKGFPGGSVIKNLPVNVGEARDVGSIPGLGRSPGGGHGNPLQYSCLENPMDRGAWRLQSMGLQRVRHNCVHVRAHTHKHTTFI